MTEPERKPPAPKPRKRDKAPKRDTAPPKRPKGFPLNQIASRIKPSIEAVAGLICLKAPADGAVILQHADDLAAALAGVAKESARAHWVLYRATQANAWGALISVSVTITVQIIANHRPDLLPGGPTSPDAQNGQPVTNPARQHPRQQPREAAS